MRARRLLGLGVGLGLGMGLAEAGDDDWSPLTPSVVHATLEGTEAKLVVRFGRRVHGPDENAFTLSAPWGSVITGATVAVDGEPHRLALMRTDAAASALGAIRDAAPGSARRWGVVITSSFSTAITTVLAPHDGSATLDLELSMPTCFYGDVRYFPVPAEWAKALDVTLRSRPIPEAAVRACTARDGETPPQLVALPSPELARQPPGEPRIGVAAGRLALPSLHVARVELDLAATLTAVPADLATAFVVDASRSVDGEELAAERRVIASYVRHAPASRVQVIAYARTAHAILPAWSLASQAAPRIDREMRALVTRNGSNVDVGLAEAATWLRRVTGTRRVVLFTDERLAEAVAKLPVATLAAVLPPGTLVHVVAIDGEADTLQRADTVFDGLATMTEGIAVRGGILDGGTGEAELLARPISFDDVTITAPGWEPSHNQNTCDTAADADQQLGEGHACTWFWEGTTLSGPITVAGRLWGHRVTRIVRPDPTHAIAIARELAPHQAFEPPINAEIEDADHAVNERWSLFGAWGGRGGYRDLPEGGGGGMAGSICGCGDPGTMGFGRSGGGTMMAPFSLETQLRNGLRACDVRHDRVEITVETTLQEIVALDVKVVDGLGAIDHGPAVHAAKQACAEEALWNVSLALQDPPFHATTELVIGAGSY